MPLAFYDFEALLQIPISVILRKALKGGVQKNNERQYNPAACPVNGMHEPLT
jgi:hypothetical protein